MNKHRVYVFSLQRSSRLLALALGTVALLVLSACSTSDPAFPSVIEADVDGYVGSEADVRGYVWNPETDDNVEIATGTLTSDGGLTLAFETPPTEVLEPVGDAEFEVSDPDTRGVGLFDFEVGNSDDPAGWLMAGSTRAAWDEAPEVGESVAMFLYVDRPVTMTFDDLTSGYRNVGSVSLRTGWNVVSERVVAVEDGTVTEVRTSDADPDDLNWFFLD